LVIIDSGRDTWSALVECKIGKAKIEVEQLESYVKKARENAINCVITISNELVADPRRPTTTVDGRLTKNVDHFHYSWLAIRSEAEILYRQGLVTDPEKNVILSELIRFLSHPSAGVEGFSQMPAPWPELIAELGSGRSLNKTDERLSHVADAWLQEEKDIALILSRLVSRRCISRSEKKLRRGGYDAKDEILSEMMDSGVLATSFTVPDTAADIDVRADMRSRSTRISMTLRATQDRKRPESRLNWLLNQLRSADTDGIEIVAHWPGRAKATFAPLAILREEPRRIVEAIANTSPYAFEVAQTCHSPAAFAGRRRFLQDIEAAIQEFYTNVGRRLSAWAPKAPAPTDKTAAAEIEEETTVDRDRLASVEQSLSAVLESLRTTNFHEGASGDQSRQQGADVSQSRAAPAGDAEKPEHR
jgi:hypothetical protein